MDKRSHFPLRWSIIGLVSFLLILILTHAAHADWYTGWYNNISPIYEFELVSPSQNQSFNSLHNMTFGTSISNISGMVGGSAIACSSATTSCMANISTLGDINPTVTQTIGFWMNWTSNNSYVFRKGTTVQYYAFIQTNGTLEFGWSNDGSGAANTNTVVSNGKDQCIVLVNNGTHEYGIINNATDTASIKTVSGAITAQVQNLTIFSDGGSSASSGRIDELFFSNNTLNTTNVQDFCSRIAADNIITTNLTLFISIYDESNSSPIRQPVTVQFTNGTAGNMPTYTTSTGKIVIYNLSTGTSTVTITSNGYDIRTYTLTITNSSLNTVNAYLTSSGNAVTFNLIDSIQNNLVIQGASIYQYTPINGITTLIDTKTSDVAGNAQFSYVTDKSYTFLITAAGYSNKTFTLSPIIGSTYTIRMIAQTSTNFSEDYQNVLITYTPKIFYANQSNTLTILFDSITNSFQYYSYNLTYPGGTNNNSGTTGAGQTFVTNFNITGGNIFSTVNLSLTYNTGFGNRTFNFTHNIIYGPANGTFAANAGQTFGMGLFERAFIGTLVILIIMGFIALINPIASLAVALFIMGLFIKMGFWEWWLAGISFLIGIVILMRRTE